jgi:LuxR family maltose regulon positive regulatory protein
MTPAPIASSKIRAPQRAPSEIERPRIDAPLAQALREPGLVLLSAPAGCGKTVALARAFDDMPVETARAWVRADVDDDIEHLVAHLIVALDPFDLPWRASPDTLAAAAAEPSRLMQVADRLATAMQHAEAPRGLIVIDDLHAVADPRVFKFLDALVADLPSHWTLAVASRFDPPMSLGRLRVSGGLREFRRADLEFDEAEVRRLLQACGVQADDDACRRLVTRTQGWAAGVKLSAGAPGKGPLLAAGSRRHLFDYLREEVMTSMPEEMQRFFVQCSLLPELTPLRCRRLTGDPRSMGWLQDLERRELFVSVIDADRLTLRFHDLFRDFLLDCLQREHADEMPTLLRRAAASEPDLARRVDYLLRAGACEEAATALLAEATAHIEASGGLQLIRLIEQFPHEFQQTSAELAYVRGLCASGRFEHNTMQTFMRRAVDGFERREAWRDALRARALASCALMFGGWVAEGIRVWEAATVFPFPIDLGTRALCELRDFVQCARLGPYRAGPQRLRAALALLVLSGQTAHWTVCYANMFVYVGRWGLREPMEALAAHLAEQGEQSPMLKAMSLQLRVWLALHRVELGTVRELVREVRSEAGWLGNPIGLHAPPLLALALDAHLCGRADEAMAIIRGITQDINQSERKAHLLYANMLACIAGVAGSWDEARGVLALTRGWRNLPDWPYLQAATACLEAEIALHEQRNEDAVDVLEPHLASLLDIEWWGLHGRMRVACARAFLRLGRHRSAWETLSPPLRQARTSGESLGLLLCGPAALRELVVGPWPESVPAAEKAWLDGYLAQAEGLRSWQDKVPAEQGPRASSERLSAREIEVLVRIARGHSNKVIARDLGLSPHTVKRHVARILEKTDQVSRGEAAFWYRTHALHDSDVTGPG